MHAQKEEIIYLTQKKDNKETFSLQRDSEMTIKRILDTQKLQKSLLSHWGSKSLFLVTFESLCRQEKKSLYCLFLSQINDFLFGPVAALRFHKARNLPDLEGPRVLQAQIC